MQNMRARLLALLALAGMVLTPFFPSQRLYICQITGAIRMECCCHVDQRNILDGDRSGCCKVIVLHQFAAPMQPHALPSSLHQEVTGIAALATPCIAVLWDGKPINCRDADSPIRPPDPIFVRHCALLI
jgi:hypothetical protein